MVVVAVADADDGLLLVVVVSPHRPPLFLTSSSTKTGFPSHPIGPSVNKTIRLIKSTNRRVSPPPPVLIRHARMRGRTRRGKERLFRRGGLMHLEY